jgi:hypothetical protein
MNIQKPAFLFNSVIGITAFVWIIVAAVYTTKPGPFYFFGYQAYVFFHAYKPFTW